MEMIILAVLAMQMMCKGEMHLFYATGALYEPNKKVLDAVRQCKKKETMDEHLEVLHLEKAYTLRTLTYCLTS